MIKRTLLVPLALVCLSFSPEAFHKVRFVYDGDTILVDGKGKVRYLGINAPEIDHKGGKDEFMAQAARSFNTKLVNGARVRLEHDKAEKDRHGRFLAYVFLENGTLVNTLLVREGLAHVMRNSRELKYKDRLLDCQRKAMQEKIGIWSRPLNGEEKFYLGNGNSYRFHRPDCPFGSKISRRNIVRFQSRHDAFWMGFSPCKNCRP